MNQGRLEDIARAVGRGVGRLAVTTGLASPAPAVKDLEAAQATRFEESALAFSRQIQERHLPHETIMDPVFAAPDSQEIVSYTRAGDSAIWTGHYLAAESFRFRVTGSPEALANARRAVEGIRTLVDVTATGLLARAAVPADSPYADAITGEEAGHGIFSGELEGKSYRWIANTSRDQYCGVFFGLSLAHELIADWDLRGAIRELATRMLDFLLRNRWFVVMPDGRISTVFAGRPDQRLTLLQIGRQVNAERFAGEYQKLRAAVSSLVVTPIAFETLDDHNSYFKFNLATINLFNLIRLEDRRVFRSNYRFAYNVLRRTTDDHGNAHFNMIDRGLKGPDRRRDSETVELLNAWLQRPRRDDFVDLRGQVEACGPDRACQPIPVVQRVRTDFLWQRSPFLLFGGGEGRIEGPGIDFLLPYWMARFYGVL
jgi:hypothetical protein